MSLRCAHPLTVVDFRHTPRVGGPAARVGSGDCIKKANAGWRCFFHAISGRSALAKKMPASSIALCISGVLSEPGGEVSKILP